MGCILSGLHWKTCLIYLNDVIIFSKTFEDHITRLHQVLTWLKEANSGCPHPNVSCPVTRLSIWVMWSPKMEWLQKITAVTYPKEPKGGVKLWCCAPTTVFLWRGLLTSLVHSIELQSWASSFSGQRTVKEPSKPWKKLSHPHPFWLIRMMREPLILDTDTSG